MDDNEIRRVIDAIAANLRGQKGTEHSGETAAGKRALSQIRNALQSPSGADAARQALEQLEQDPTDADVKRRLVSELAQLADRRPTFRAALERIADDLTKKEPRTTRGFSADFSPASKAGDSRHDRGTTRSMYSPTNTDQDDRRE